MLKCKLCRRLFVAFGFGMLVLAHPESTPGDMDCRHVLCPVEEAQPQPFEGHPNHREGSKIPVQSVAYYTSVASTATGSLDRPFLRGQAT